MLILAIILFGLSLLLKFQAWRHPAFRARLNRGDFLEDHQEVRFRISISPERRHFQPYCPGPATTSCGTTPSRWAPW